MNPMDVRQAVVDACTFQQTTFMASRRDRGGARQWGSLSTETRPCIRRSLQGARMTRVPPPPYPSVRCNGMHWAFHPCPSGAQQQQAPQAGPPPPQPFC